MFKLLFLIATLIGTSFGETCPTGGDIYEHFIDDNDINEVLDIHNKYRLDIANGRVPNQPQGSNLLRMSWHEGISIEARKVSQTCLTQHIYTESEEFGWVGQNIYISWSYYYSPTRNWTEAVTSWFNEHENFVYPNGTSPNYITDDYTQLVWANSSSLGCDYISFYDVLRPSVPYAKMYTCNYGPGGNLEGEAPYEEGVGCTDLC